MRRLMSRLMVAAFCGNGATNCAVADECSPDAPRHPPHAITGQTCPDIGRMGTTKIAVPQHYIDGPSFIYKGVDVWKADSYKNRPKKQSFDNEVSDIGINVRLTDFKPIENRKDKDDYYRFSSELKLEPVANRWIGVDIKYPPIIATDLRIPLDRFVNSDVRPHLVKTKNPMWGLDHYVGSMPSPEDGIGPVNEVFYDAKTNGTLILCTNFLVRDPPHEMKSSCHLHFLDRKKNISFEVMGIQDISDLARWKEIHNGVIAVFESFVVN